MYVFSMPLRSSISIYGIIKNIFGFQIIIGVSANTPLLLFYTFRFLLRCRQKPTNLTTSYLALVHILMFLTVLYLLYPDLFKLLNIWNDFKCKAFFYMSKVMRSLSILITCLLSLLQAVTISPSTSWLLKFKYRSTKYIVHL